MGTAKKKKEKKKDFLKPKLKVGKAKPKASNFTDTSFQSKAIVMAKQSLLETAPDATQQFKHNLVQAATGRTDTQRRDALAYLTSQLSQTPPFNPAGTRALLDKLLPLLSDRAAPVRAQLLKLLRVLPPAQVAPHVEKAVLYVCAGLTNLSRDVNADSLAATEWLLEVAGPAMVAAPGGWVRPLKTLCAVLGWSDAVMAPPGKGRAGAAAAGGGWTEGSTGAATSLRAQDVQAHARQMAVLAALLRAGLRAESKASPRPGWYWDREWLTRLPRGPSPYAHLRLYGAPKDEDGQMYQTRTARQNVFNARFRSGMLERAGRLRRSGGAAGRAAGLVETAIAEGMDGFEVEDMVYDWRDLRDLW